MIYKNSDGILLEIFDTGEVLFNGKPSTIKQINSQIHILCVENEYSFYIKLNDTFFELIDVDNEFGNLLNSIYYRDDKVIDITNYIKNRRIIKNDNHFINSILGKDPLTGKDKFIKNTHLINGNIIEKNYRIGDRIDLYPDNKLIYLTPVGVHYRKMAKYCVKSLRKNGNYKGKIIVFTDMIDEHMRDIEKLADIICLQFYCHPLVNRIFALDYINYELYEKILYLDCDCYCQKNIYELFNFEDNFKFMEEPWHYNKNTYSGSIDTFYFTQEEINITYANFHPINSGHFAIKRDYFLEFKRIYKDIYNSKQEFAWGLDQSSMNAAIRKNIMVGGSAYNHDIICVPAKQKIDEKYFLLHFAGYGKREYVMEEMWKQDASK